MTNERLTLQEIEQKYPDAWLLIVDCEISENTELLSGVVAAHSKSREDIHNAGDPLITQRQMEFRRESPARSSERGCVLSAFFFGAPAAQE